MARGFCRIGIDTAGGVIIGPPKSSTVFVNNVPVALGNAKVDDKHEMIKSSSSVFIEGLNPDRELDKDTGDDVATGSPNVFCGD